MPLDDEIRALEKACRESGMTQAAIDEEIAHLRSLEQAAQQAETNGLRELAARLRDAIRNRIAALLERAPKLGKLLHLIFQRKALGGQVGKALGKVIKLGASTAGLVFLEVLFYAPEDSKAAWGEFELVNSIPMEDSSGDEIHCAVMCVYRGPKNIVIGGVTDPYPKSGDQWEIVSIHEYDCGKPPSPEVLKQFCRKSLYAVIAD